MITCHHLGRVEYPDGLELQHQVLEARRAGLVPDTLLLLEHPPVLTQGRGAKATNIIAAPSTLEAMGVGVFDTDRGGDVTYHGPGQLVGYPIFHLPPGRQDVRRYVRMLEEVIIRTLHDVGLKATRIEKWPGVWMESSRAGGPRKICALGVHLSRWFTTHGFALNVRPDLTHFGLIVPCGIREAGVTSIEAELGVAPRMHEVERLVARHFGDVFEAPIDVAAEPTRTVSIAVVRREPRDEVLVLKRSLERGGFWQLVTGRVEADEPVERAAARELAEETGLELGVSSLGYEHSFAWGSLPTDAEGRATAAPRLARESAFVALAPPGAQVRLSSEHTEAQWLGPTEASARVPFEGLRQAIKLAATFTGRKY